MISTMTAFERVPIDKTTIPQGELNIDNKTRSNLFVWNGQFSPQFIEVLLNYYALLELAQAPNTQVIITTHSAPIVRELNLYNIRLIRNVNGEKIVENVSRNQLPYPSLNEVNYLAFSEISAEYHDELYGYIDEQGWLNEYKIGKPTRTYIRLNRDGTTKEEQKILSEYI